MYEYVFEHCFPGDEFGYELTVLVGTESLTGMKFGTAVLIKSSSGKFAVDRALDFIVEVGGMDGQIITKNDQEPSNFSAKIWWRAGNLGGPIWRNLQLKAVGAMEW